ncbi:hypothetical protein C818_04192 [Lachnospiraceae bacterium MD308]|nr:hypothetical protein C818_04192 [Lachnospiraceae bacterium MD308]
MKVNSIKISRLDSVFDVEINGILLENVSDYRVKSSADGTTELELKLNISGAFMEFGTSANQTKQTSSDQ